MATFIQGLKELLASGQDLPTLPQIVFELHRALDDELASGEQIAAIINKDPALTAKLLRAANSAYFAAGRDAVDTIQGALARMGMGQVRATCLVLSVVKTFSNWSQGLDHQQFWDHSAYVGLVAQHVWKELGVDRSGTAMEHVYVAGLLHDVGILVMDQFFQEEFRSSREKALVTGTSLAQVEDEELGMDHGHVGGLMLGRWQLPERIAECVTYHHNPDLCPDGSRQMCLVVSAAETIAAEYGVGKEVEGENDKSSEEALMACGFDVDDIPEVLERAREVGRGSSAFVSV